MNRRNASIVLALMTTVFSLTALSFTFIWYHAPEVGGAWWPYIRITVSIVGALIVGKLSVVASQLVLLWVFGRSLFDDSPEFDPDSGDTFWDDETIEEFMEEIKPEDDWGEELR